MPTAALRALLSHRPQRHSAMRVLEELFELHDQAPEG
jgi:hypothetical protein